MKATREEYINYLNKEIKSMKSEIIIEVFKENSDYDRIDGIKRAIKAYEETIREYEKEDVI